MARRFITPRLNSLFAAGVTELINELNKRYQFQVLLVTKTRCPNCIYDAVQNCSTGRYRTGGPSPFNAMCPVCNNKGMVETQVKRIVVANVRLGTSPAAADTPLPEGQLPSNIAQVKTVYTNKKLIDDAKAFFVDGMRYSRINLPNPRGLQSKVSYIFFMKRDD